MHDRGLMGLRDRHSVCHGRAHRLGHQEQRDRDRRHEHADVDRADDDEARQQPLVRITRWFAHRVRLPRFERDRQRQRHRRHEVDPEDLHGLDRQDRRSADHRESQRRRQDDQRLADISPPIDWMPAKGTGWRRDL